MFENIYQGKKILITGNTGFKGSWLSAWMSYLGADVFGLSIDIPTSPAMFTVNKLEQEVQHTYADIRDLDKVVQVFNAVQPDFVFHLAAQPIVKTAYEAPVDTMSSNIMGTLHVLEALRKSRNPCTAVLVTSDKCYDNVEWVWGYREHDSLGGKDPYSASKGAAELMIKTYFHSYFNKPDSLVKIAAVRAGNVIGGGDWAASRIVPDCIRAWSADQAVEIRSPQSTRPWQHVLEPLSGYLRVGQLLYQDGGLNGEAFNFGPAADQNQTVLALLIALSKHWRFSANSERYHIHENPGFHEAGLLKLNCDKALFQLGWRPCLNFEQTTKLTAEWYNAYYNEQNVDMSAYTLEQIKEYVQIAEQNKQAWIH